MKYIILILSCLFLPTPNNTNAIDAVPEIDKLAGKTRQEVKSVLGNPVEVKRETLNRVKVVRAEYIDGKIEIAYVDGEARYITMFLEQCSEFQEVTEETRRCIEYEPVYTDYEFSDPGCKRLFSDMGLENPGEPGFSNWQRKSWNDLSGLQEVTVYSDGDGGIKYVNITAKGKYE